MVYNGPSGGCKTCRTRRVKCDQTKPACNNCIRRKQPCPGYADVFDGAHRSQNTIVVRRVEKQKNSSKDAKGSKTSAKSEASSPKSEASSELSASSSTTMLPTTNKGPLQWIVYATGTNTSSTASPESSHESESSEDVAGPSGLGTDSDRLVTTLPEQLRYDPQTAAIGFFFRHYNSNFVQPRAYNGLQNVWQPMYLTSGVESPLRTATAAVAVNISMMWCFRGCDTRLPRSLFTQAIAATRKAMYDPSESKTDELLMTILAFDLYDTILLHYTPGVPNHGKHKEGALALIKHRGEANNRTPRSRGMLEAVRHLAIPYLLNERKPFPEDVLGLFQQQSTLPSTLTSLDHMATNLITIQADLWTLRREDPATVTNERRRAQFEAIISRAVTLETQMMNWKAAASFSHIRTYFIDRDSVAPSIVAAGFYGSHCAVWLDLIFGDLWAKHALRSIYNMQIIRQALADEPSLLVEQKYQSLLTHADVQIQNFADLICQSVPFHIGDTAVLTNPLQADSISYPYTFTHDPETGLNQRVPDLLANYQARAASIGGWIIYPQLVSIYRFLEPEDDALPINLRPGQLDWIKGQVRRLQRIFLFVDPPWFKRLPRARGCP